MTPNEERAVKIIRSAERMGEPITIRQLWERLGLRSRGGTINLVRRLRDRNLISLDGQRKLRVAS